MEKPKINKIRAYREALNLSQKEMGKLINVHRVVYSRKERKIVNFTDKEKITLLTYFKKFFPDETIDTLFF